LLGSGNTLLGSLAFFNVNGGAISGTNFNAALTQLACFAAGTMIATTRGPVKVEDLRAGDMVALHGGGTAPAVWIGSRAVDCARHPRPETVWPIRVRAGAFGQKVGEPAMPERDLLLSPDHAVFVEDVLIPIKFLVNESSITQIRVPEVHYFHVELPEHDILIAEGLPAESYLDTGDRTNFANGDGVVRLFPDFAVSPAMAGIWEARGYAPLRAVGPEVDSVRRRLNHRAAGNGIHHIEPRGESGVARFPAN
ncbi:MAG: Hint domain-containing protein, partial [Acetobacteraceae bacterium]|nr:Hint domain-containing protein [Acetobacteraceae bacterium]